MAGRERERAAARERLRQPGEHAAEALLTVGAEIIDQCHNQYDGTQGNREAQCLTGELDLASAPILERALQGEDVTGAPLVVLDLDSLEFVDSTGLRTVMNSVVASALQP